MKKYICFISLIGLCACATTTERPDNGLTRLRAEPSNCQFVYTMDSSVATYKQEDAYDYMEKSILEQKMFDGDSYYIVDESILDNQGAVFGPEHTYKFKVKVYKCNK